MNTFKYIWSLWDKIDKVVFMLAIALCLLSIPIMCSACDSTTHYTIPSLEGDEIIDVYTESLYPENVIDLVYDPMEDGYYIIYCDHGIRPEKETEKDSIIYIYTNRVFFEDFSDWYKNHENVDYPCTIYDIKVIELINGWEFYLNKKS